MARLRLEREKAPLLALVFALALNWLFQFFTIYPMIVLALTLQFQYFSIYHMIAVRYDKDSIEGRRAGTWLAGGYVAILVAIGGDLDYLAKTLQLPRWSKASSPCSLCRCTKSGPLSYLDNRLGLAGWLGVIWNHRSWKVWVGRSQCSLFAVVAWLSGCNVCLDYMHAKHLGADQYIFGSVLYYLVYIHMPGSAIQNLQIIWKWMLAYYKKTKSAPCTGNCPS